MKKSLSLLLALAMVFGMFASVAAAADDNATLTTEQKYQQLVDSKVLKGNPDGPQLASNLTRAQFATIAVAVGGLKEDTSASAFKDVVAGQWWHGAIQAAYNAGLVNGVGNGLFSPKANVTVQEVIKVAVLLAKLTPVADATVEGAADWAGPYIKAAQDAGLPVSGNYTAAATRGQTIDLAYAVIQSLTVPSLSDVTATANPDDTITVAGKASAKTDSVKVALGTGEAVAATLKDDKTFTYTTAKQAVGTYTLTVVAYEGTKASAKVEKSVTIEGFKLVSVTVLNGKQLAVKFNKAVKEGTSEGAVKYATEYFSLADQTVADKSLSDDKTTLTITFDHFSPLDRYAEFKIADGLKSASGQSLGEQKQAVYLSDKTAPSVKGVSYSGKNAIIEFSEPLSDIGAVSIDGSLLSGGYTTNEDADHDFTKLTIPLADVDTNYTVDIVSATDIAGNYLNYTATLKAPSDDTPPTVSSLTVNGAKVTVKFSEKLLKDDDESYATLTVYSASGEVDVQTIAPSSYDDDTNTAVFNLAEILGENKSFLIVPVNFKAGSFQDLLENPNKATTKQNITLTADKTPPKFQSVTTSGNEIIIKFDEEVQQTLGALTYSLTDGDGVLTKGDLGYTPRVGYDANDNGNPHDAGEDNYVVLTVSDLNGTAIDKLPAGKYSITLPKAQITDNPGDPLTPNALAADVKLAFTVTSSAAGGVVELEGVTQDADNNSILVFEFNNELTTSQLVNTKFLINGVVLPASTDLHFEGDRKHVYAVLPAGTIAVSGKRTFKVVGIVDKDGNTLKSGKDSYATTTDIIENVPPKALSATFVDDKTIVVKFSEKLGDANKDGLTVTINGTALDDSKIVDAVVDTNDASGKTVIVTVFDPNTFKSGQTVVVKLSGSGIKDTNNNGASDIDVTVK